MTQTVSLTPLTDMGPAERARAKFASEHDRRRRHAVQRRAATWRHGELIDLVPNIASQHFYDQGHASSAPRDK